MINFKFSPKRRISFLLGIFDLHRQPRIGKF